MLEPVQTPSGSDMRQTGSVAPPTMLCLTNLEPVVIAYRWRLRERMAKA